MTDHLLLRTILQNHLEWCKKEGRDTSWANKPIDTQEWYKRRSEAEKKRRAAIAKKKQW